MLPKLAFVDQKPNNIGVLSELYYEFMIINNVGQVNDCKNPFNNWKIQRYAMFWNYPNKRRYGINAKLAADASIAIHKHLTGLFSGYIACIKCPKPRANNIKESNTPINLFSISIYLDISALLDE